jgi:hypothetical protein
MKFSTLSILATAVILTGCSTARNQEMLLSAAGFKTIVPTTPKQIAKVKSLPQLKVVPINKKGQTFFVFADANRNTLLIGNQQQYSAYQQYALQYKIQEDKVAAASLNADAAEWGGFGSFNDGFWGPGVY